MLMSINGAGAGGNGNFLGSVGAVPFHAGSWLLDLRRTRLATEHESLMMILRDLETRSVIDMALYERYTTTGAIEIIEKAIALIGPPDQVRVLRLNDDLVGILGKWGRTRGIDVVAHFPDVHRPFRKRRRDCRPSLPRPFDVNSSTRH